MMTLWWFGKKRIVTEASDLKRIDITGWWATGPEPFLDMMRSQLDAARALWPEELKDISIGKNSARVLSVVRDNDGS